MRLKYFIIICSAFFVLEPCLASQTDTLHTVKYITQIYLSEPERALRLLDEAEQGKQLSPFQAERLRGMVYNGKGMYQLALLHVKRASASNSAQQTSLDSLRIKGLLMTINLRLNNYLDCIENAGEGLKLARMQEDRRAEADFLSGMGQCFSALKQQDRADSCMRMAVHILESTDDVREMAMLSYTYGEWMRLLFDAGFYEKMLAIGREREALIDRMSRMPGPPEDYIDQQYGYLFSKMAVACLKTGREKEATRYFDRYRATKSASTLKGRKDALPYLLLTKQYTAAAQIYNDCVPYYQDADTLGGDFIGLLSNSMSAAEGLRDFKTAYQQSERIRNITDSLSARDKRNAALELATIYRTQEQNAEIDKSHAALRTRNITVALLALLVALLVVILWVTIRYNRIIRYKNRVMARTIEERLRYEDALQQNRSDDSIVQAADISENVNPETEKRNGELRTLFRKLDQIVCERKLYLDPFLSREDLLQMINVSKNQIAGIIQAGAGCNTTDYLNNLRLEHAIRMLVKYPQYKIAVVAQESGLPNMSTFYRLFRMKFGITPAEFRKGLLNDTGSQMTA